MSRYITKKYVSCGINIFGKTDKKNKKVLHGRKSYLQKDEISKILSR